MEDQQTRTVRTHGLGARLLWHSGPFVSFVRGVNLLQSRGGYFPDGRDMALSFRTVEGLFNEARNAIRTPADEVELTFDEEFGYPKRVLVDRIRQAVDDELAWMATVSVIAQ